MIAGTLLTAVLIILPALWLYLYTLPGLRRLPKERRTTQDGVITIEEAATVCRRSGQQGWDLVA